MRASSRKGEGDVQAPSSTSHDNEIARISLLPCGWPRDRPLWVSRLLEATGRALSPTRSIETSDEQQAMSIELQLLFDGPDDATPIVVLAHGAGAPMDSDWMNDIAGRLAERDLRVARFEFPYMRRRREDGKRRRPDRPAVLEETWVKVVDRLGGGSEVIVGGKSMGGRIASRIADRAGARGLVCLGYPFHPPGRPEVLRTAHLKDLQTPTLILQGTRDPFGKPEEVETYELSPRIQVRWLEDGDHSFRPRVKSGHTLDGNLDRAASEAALFLSSLD